MQPPSQANADSVSLVNQVAALTKQNAEKDVMLKNLMARVRHLEQEKESQLEQEKENARRKEAEDRTMAERKFAQLIQVVAREMGCGASSP